MTLRQIKEVFCLRLDFMFDRIKNDDQFSKTVNCLKEFTFEDALCQLEHALSNDSKCGTATRYYYMKKVLTRLRLMRDEKIKCMKLPTDSPLRHYVEAIINSWQRRDKPRVKLPEQTPSPVQV